MKSGESGKDCKGVVAQKDKREWNLWLRCNTCKQFCILFIQKLGASGVAVGEVCSFDGMVLWKWGVQQYFGLSASVKLSTTHRGHFEMLVKIAESGCAMVTCRRLLAETLYLAGRCTWLVAVKDTVPGQHTLLPWSLKLMNGAWSFFWVLWYTHCPPPCCDWGLIPCFLVLLDYHTN